MQVFGALLTSCLVLTAGSVCVSGRVTDTEMMPCEDFSPSSSIPESVHELRPGDIKVVAAVGDSLTAGNGIASKPSNVLDVLREYRGLSWSVGGDENLTSVTTLPNILRYFNPNLTGFSLGVGHQGTSQASLNRAVAGAISKDVPSQVRDLVARMKNDPTIDFESDWKLVSVFIGGNDLCHHCFNPRLYSGENYARNVRDSLDYLHQEVPRALVNLIEPLHVVPLRDLHMDRSVKCPTWLTGMLCPCVVLPRPNSKALRTLDDLNRSYQRRLHELVESGRYDTRSDFTVVIQPFFRDIVVPRLPDGRPDRSFFSADCFHLSQKAHALLARCLWNNMLEPLGNKTLLRNLSTPVNLKCPTETSPYIRTFNNSDYVYAGIPPPPGPKAFKSLPRTPVTTTTAADAADTDLFILDSGADPTIPLPNWSSSVPVWEPVTVGLVLGLGFLAVVTVSWMILCCCCRRQMNKEGSDAEM